MAPTNELYPNGWVKVLAGGGHTVEEIRELSLAASRAGSLRLDGRRKYTITHDGVALVVTERSN